MAKYDVLYKSEFATLDVRYDIVNDHIGNLIKGTSVTPLILEGPAGVGKTSMVEHFMKSHGHTQYQKVAGKITPMALFMNLYALRNKCDILILDDTDTAYDNIDALNILKAAMDSNPIREVSWISARQTAGLPNQFTTEGSIIVLSNNTFTNSGTSKKHEHLRAIMSRGFHVAISDDNEENKFIQICYMVYRHNMLNHLSADSKIEVLDYLNHRKSSFKQFDLRTAIKVAELYVTQPTKWEVHADIML